MASSRACVILLQNYECGIIIEHYCLLVFFFMCGDRWIQRRVYFCVKIVGGSTGLGVSVSRDTTVKF
jgi:hypothetical protein